MNTYIHSRAAAIGYLVVLCVAGVAGARFAASSFLAESAIRSVSPGRALAAIRIDGANPRAFERLGILFESTSDFDQAAAMFQEAVRLSPNDHRLWLRLAESQFRTGDRRAAESSYIQAIELAPNYSLPYMAAGRMYSSADQNDEALRFFAAGARIDPTHYPEALKSAARAFDNDPGAMERALAPLSLKGKSIVAWYFLDRALMTEATRAFLLSDELGVEEKNTVIRFLKEKRRYALAREVWLSRKRSDGDTVDERAPLYDGGFELLTHSDPAGFGWQIDTELPYVSVARSQGGAYSGRVALNIRFAGNVELQRPVVSQLAHVEPGKAYRLTFYFRVRELVSAGLPRLVVTNAETNEILAQSGPIYDPGGEWVARSIPFKAPESPVVLVSVQRPECSANPCPIFGELSIDEFSIDAIEP